VERIVGRIEIEHQHLYITRQAAHAQFQKCRLHRLRCRVQLPVIIKTAMGVATEHAENADDAEK
jgi:hypothetical protein